MLQIYPYSLDLVKSRVWIKNLPNRPAPNFVEATTVLTPVSIPTLPSPVYSVWTWSACVPRFSGIEAVCSDKWQTFVTSFMMGIPTVCRVYNTKDRQPHVFAFHPASKPSANTTAQIENIKFLVQGGSSSQNHWWMNNLWEDIGNLPQPLMKYLFITNIISFSIVTFVCLSV